MQDKEKKKYITIAELAEILHISRIAVYKKVKKGQVPAERIGRNFFIPIEYIQKDVTVKVPVLKVSLTENEKNIIKKAVEKTVMEYGDTLKLLGRE